MRSPTRRALGLTRIASGAPRSSAVACRPISASVDLPCRRDRLASIRPKPAICLASPRILMARHDVVAKAFRLRLDSASGFALARVGAENSAAGGEMRQGAAGRRDGGGVRCEHWRRVGATHRTAMVARDDRGQCRGGQQDRRRVQRLAERIQSRAGIQGHLCRDDECRHRRLPRRQGARTSSRSSRSAPRR